MKKKMLILILPAILCVAVLGVTIWCVWSDIKGAMPEPLQDPAQDLPLVAPPVQEEMNPPIDENGFPVDEYGNPIDGNVLIDPWAEAPAEESQETSEAPTDSEEVSDDQDLAVTDEGWSGIY